MRHDAAGLKLLFPQPRHLTRQNLQRLIAILKSAGLRAEFDLLQKFRRPTRPHIGAGAFGIVGQPAAAGRILLPNGRGEPHQLSGRILNQDGEELPHEVRVIQRHLTKLLTVQHGL